jgi:tRNA dimethylallyltransferase
MSEKIIVISGPTASGKSSLTLEIANFKDVIIINADSLQIYQGLPILSAQPTFLQQQQVDHKLYSYLKPHQSSSVALWLKLAESEIKKSWQHNKTPIIVGGSGMYISKLIEGINEIPETSAEVKNSAKREFEEIGIEEFRKKLIALGEEKELILKLDKQRLIRVYEVLQQTKKSLFWWQKQKPKTFFAAEIFTHINLNPDRQILYQNCNLRFNQMIEKGVIDEVQKLKKDNILPDSQITKTLGYQEISLYLENKIDKNLMIEIAAQKTRNYAKRQLTWFRNQLSEKNIFANIDEAKKFLNQNL